MVELEPIRNPESAIQDASRRVCVVGSANTDMVVKCPHLPAPGETVLGGRFVTAPGGKGANQAVAAARCGAEVTFVACLGDDALGDQALEHCRAEGIDVSWIRRVAGTPSGVALIFVDDAGENEIVVVSGANGLLTPADVEAASAAIAAADVLLVQLETPLETIFCALRIAREHGVTTILDPAPAQSLSGDLLRLTDLAIPNEHELSVLTGRDVQSPGDELAAAERLLVSGVGGVIVTLGGRGALVVTRNGSERLAGVPVEAVDATAAGDAFAGGLAAGLAGGGSLKDALRFATATSALSVTKLGAQPSLPTQSEVERFLGRQ